MKCAASSCVAGRGNATGEEGRRAGQLKLGKNSRGQERKHSWRSEKEDKEFTFGHLELEDVCKPSKWDRRTGWRLRKSEFKQLCLKFSTFGNSVLVKAKLSVI